MSTHPLYRCSYCCLPLTDDDIARDGEALFCTDCGHRVEYFDALDAAEEAEEAEERGRGRTLRLRGLHCTVSNTVP